MRPPPNERLSDSGAHTPERKCILTGERAPKPALIRLALSPASEVAPDVRACAPGRGAWIGVDRAHLEASLAKGKLKGALIRALRVPALTVPDDLPAAIEAALERAVLNRFGLEARAGHVITGAERIEKAARGGALHALFHAHDAGSDGVASLAQAWRVGQGTEGSGLSGISLPVDRHMLSAALGRENAVHLALDDARAALRVLALLRRWFHYIALPLPDWAVESETFAPPLSTKLNRDRIETL
ncbi:MAG: DUF448 domain-containing protein [Alphaproteobacteria bacterium]|nr:DUF448 domain-containing protein [Alphaproteobacteria bacterium]MDE2340388.1 DUF448 domain-containing protein [Alphaproteobacteria bacterium]